MFKIYPYLIIFLAALWLSVTVFFVGPENFSISLKSRGGAAAPNQINVFYKATNDVVDPVSAAASFFNIVKTAFASHGGAHNITLIKAGNGQGLYRDNLVPQN